MILTPSFKMAVVSGTTVVTGIQFTGIGQNSTLVQQHRDPQLTGNSAVALAWMQQVRPRRCQFVSLTLFKTLHMFLVATRLFPEVIVKINAPSMDGDGVSSGGHMYNNAAWPIRS
jgi:hypothetical protein